VKKGNEVYCSSKDVIKLFIVKKKKIYGDGLKGFNKEIVF
jgi:hypothetical protein